LPMRGHEKGTPDSKYLDARDGHTQLFGRDGGHLDVDTLPHLGSAVGHEHRPVQIHTHLLHDEWTNTRTREREREHERERGEKGTETDKRERERVAQRMEKRRDGKQKRKKVRNRVQKDGKEDEKRRQGKANTDGLTDRKTQTDGQTARQRRHKKAVTVHK
jgi:hypothetical protein